MIHSGRSHATKIASSARSMRRMVIEMCKERGGYAGQGIALSDVIAALYFNAMRREDDGSYKDRFVLSNGHDSIAVYAALAEIGVYSRDELLSYGADGSPIDMAPVEGALGFEITTGSLGQGLSQAAGIALGERLRGRDTDVYCLISDGELQEGHIWESVMFAAHHKLDNLILMIDNNDLQVDGRASEVMGVEPVPQKFEAFGWSTARIDGNDVDQIVSAFAMAKTSVKPFAIVCDTKLCAGVPSLQKQYARAHYIEAEPAIWEKALAELEEERV